MKLLEGYLNELFGFQNGEKMAINIINDIYASQRKYPGNPTKLDYEKCKQTKSPILCTEKLHLKTDQIHVKLLSSNEYLSKCKNNQECLNILKERIENIKHLIKQRNSNIQKFERK